MDLFKAIKKQNIDRLKIILSSRNIDIDVKKSGQTPLHWAAITGNVEIMKILLDLGPDVNIKSSDFHQKTPLHLACKYGSFESIKLLLRSGADVNSIDRYGNTPLHKASAKGKTDIVDLLLFQNAAINVSNSNNTSALHVAAVHGHMEVVQILLHCGIDKFMKNKSGETAQSYALKNKHINISSFIMSFNHKEYLENSQSCSTVSLNEENEPVTKSLYAAKKNSFKILDQRLTQLQEMKCELQQLFALDGIRLKKAEENLVIAQTRYQFTKDKMTQLDDEINNVTLDKCTLSKKLSVFEVDSNNNNISPEERYLYECPICYEVPLPPMCVYQCHHGHIYCQKCKMKSGMQYCPQCR